MNVLEAWMDAAVTAQTELWDCHTELFQHIATLLNIDELTDDEQSKVENAIIAAAVSGTKGAMHINDMVRIIKEGRA